MTADQREYYALEVRFSLFISVRWLAGVLPAWEVKRGARGAVERLQACASHSHSQACSFVPSTPPAPPSPSQDFYGAADEVPLPFDQSEAAGPDNWTKKM